MADNASTLYTDARAIADDAAPIYDAATLSDDIAELEQQLAQSRPELDHLDPDGRPRLLVRVPSAATTIDASRCHNCSPLPMQSVISPPPVGFQPVIIDEKSSSSSGDQGCSSISNGPIDAGTHGSEKVDPSLEVAQPKSHGFISLLPLQNEYGRPALEYIDPSPSDFEAINLRVDQQEELRRCVTSGPRAVQRRSPGPDTPQHRLSRSNKRAARADSIPPKCARQSSRQSPRHSYRSPRDSSGSPPPPSNSRTRRRRLSAASEVRCSTTVPYSSGIKTHQSSAPISMMSDEELEALGSAVLQVIRRSDRGAATIHDSDAEAFGTGFGETIASLAINRTTGTVVDMSSSDSTESMRSSPRRRRQHNRRGCSAIDDKLLKSMDTEYQENRAIIYQLRAKQFRRQKQYDDLEDKHLALREQLAIEKAAHVRQLSIIAEHTAENQVLTQRLARSDARVDDLGVVIRVMRESMAEKDTKHEQTREHLAALQDNLFRLAQAISGERATHVSTEDQLVSHQEVLETQVRADSELQHQLRCEVDRLQTIVLAGHIKAPRQSSDGSLEHVSDAPDVVKINERLNLRIVELEDALQVARSAAAAAVTAAQQARRPSNATMDSLPARERIDPQALRQSILVLQDQLRDSDIRNDQLEAETGRLVEALRDKDSELAWLRDLKSLNDHELTDMLELLSQPHPKGIDLQTLKAMVIRMRTNLQMEEASRTNPPCPSRAPETAGSTNVTPPKLGQFAATLGNWQQHHGASPSESLTSGQDAIVQTPSHGATKAASYLYGFWTPPGSERAPESKDLEPIPLAGLGRPNGTKTGLSGSLGDGAMPTKHKRSFLSFGQHSYDRDARLGIYDDEDEDPARIA